VAGAVAGRPGDRALDGHAGELDEPVEAVVLTEGQHVVGAGRGLQPGHSVLVGVAKFGPRPVLGQPGAAVGDDHRLAVDADRGPRGRDAARAVAALLDHRPGVDLRDRLLVGVGDPHVAPVVVATLAV